MFCCLVGWVELRCTHRATQETHRATQETHRDDLVGLDLVGLDLVGLDLVGFTPLRSVLPTLQLFITITFNYTH